jgi:hypothetical protein
MAALGSFRVPSVAKRPSRTCREAQENEEKPGLASNAIFNRSSRSAPLWKFDGACTCADPSFEVDLSGNSGADPDRMNLPAGFAGAISHRRQQRPFLKDKED